MSWFGPSKREGASMGWFVPSKEEAYERFSEEIGAKFRRGEFWKSTRFAVQVRVDQWTITLDTPLAFTFNDADRRNYNTRLRAPYSNPDAFRFAIYQASFLSGLGKILWMEDVETGDPAFDEAFVVKGNDESKLVNLFADPGLRERFMSLPRMRLEVKDRDRFFGSDFPGDADELCLVTRGLVLDPNRLKDLCDLFAVLLRRLCLIGAAHKYDPGVRL